MIIRLPFPSSILAGHAKGNGQWAKIKATKDHREWARLATLSEVGTAETGIPDTGDIVVTIRFIPPNNRGDRINYPNRMKPYFDGIADALKVNDKRFHPMFVFCDVEAPGRVEVFINMSSGVVSQNAHYKTGAAIPASIQTKTADASATNPRTRHTRNAYTERSI